MDDDCAIKTKHARIDFVDSSRGIEKKFTDTSFSKEILYPPDVDG